jgi:hypothetical protein
MGPGLAVRRTDEKRQARQRPANDNAAGRRVIVLFPPDLPVTEAELQLVEVWLSGIIGSLARAEAPPPDNDNIG